MRVVFARHAESTGNAEGRWLGRAEFKLSDKGRTQAQSLSRRLIREDLQFSCIYSSPQLRAMETAQIVAEPWSLPVVSWGDLMENGAGVFEGLTREEVLQKHPGAWKDFLASKEKEDWGIVEGAESFEGRHHRASRVIETIVKRHTHEESILLVTHGGILRHLLAVLMGAAKTWGFSAANTALFDFSIDPRCWLEAAARHNPPLWRFNRFNDVFHLGS